MTHDVIEAALVVALMRKEANALWLHLLTLCQRMKSTLRPRVDACHVYLGELRLTYHNRTWIIADRTDPYEALLGVLLAGWQEPGEARLAS